MACITMRIAATLFSTLIFLHCFPSLVHSVSFKRIRLPPNATGPESLAFESPTGRFYTSIADGRILKYQGQTAGFVDFGYAAPNRSRSLCDGRTNANPNPACGRPFGLGLHQATQKLYVCDAYFGFGVLGPEGGQATILSTIADGQPYRFCNGLHVHQPTGNVYFTDASAVYELRQLPIAVIARDSTGRLLKYDIKTKEVTVLLRNLSGAAGVAVDEEEKFALVSEFITGRTLKIWLQGPKANQSEIINRQQTPDNIKRTESGNFWLAAAAVIVPIGQRLNESGSVLQTVDFGRWYGVESISEVQEYGGKLYVGSRLVNSIGVYSD
ncbi:hypothetical protein PTKIN_Ptkin05aG0187600 [Pterospermum kingtungense]